MNKRNVTLSRAIFGGLLLLTILLPLQGHAGVEKRGESTFLVDQKGERWDITQAVSIGFDPYHFEFGIGRNAFRPLDDNHWYPDTRHQYRGMRVIGIAGENESHAYAVGTLRQHETANTFLGGDAIVAGY